MLETRRDQGGTNEARWKMGREQEMLCSSCLPLLALTGHQGRGAWAGDPAGTSPAPTEQRLLGPKRKQPKSRGISDIFQNHQLIRAHPAQPDTISRQSSLPSIPRRLLRRHLRVHTHTG